MILKGKKEKKNNSSEKGKKKIGEEQEGKNKNIYKGERMREGVTMKKNKWVYYCGILQSTISKVYNLISSKVSEVY